MQKIPAFLSFLPQFTSACTTRPSMWWWRPSSCCPSGPSWEAWTLTLRTTRTGYSLLVSRHDRPQRRLKLDLGSTEPPALRFPLSLCRGDGVAWHLRRGGHWNHLQHVRRGQLDEDGRHPSRVPAAFVFCSLDPVATRRGQSSTALKSWLLFASPSAYNDSRQRECNYYNCTKGKYFIQNTFSAPEHTKWACPFTQSMLGTCSGSQDPTFGYNCTMPCVIIKMNRVKTHQSVIKL